MSTKSKTYEVDSLSDFILLTIDKARLINTAVEGSSDYQELMDNYDGSTRFILFTNENSMGEQIIRIALRESVESVNEDEVEEAAKYLLAIYNYPENINYDNLIVLSDNNTTEDVKSLKDLVKDYNNFVDSFTSGIDKAKEKYEVYEDSSKQLYKKIGRVLEDVAKTNERLYSNYSLNDKLDGNVVQPINLYESFNPNIINNDKILVDRETFYELILDTSYIITEYRELLLELEKYRKNS